MLFRFSRFTLLLGIINASGRGTVNCFLSVASIVGQGVAATKHRPTDFNKQLWTVGNRYNEGHSHALYGTNEPNVRNEFIGKNKGDLFKLSMIAIVATISAVSVPLFFSKVLEALTATKFDLHELLKPLSLMLLCHTVEPIMTILYIQKCSLLIDRFISTLRMSVYSNLLRRDVASFESNSPFSSSQLVTGEIDKIKISAMSNISRDRGLRSILELVSGLGILYKLCVPLAMFFSTIIPITAYVSSRYANGLFRAAAKEGEASTKQATRVLETISNFKEVYSFSNQPLEERRFSEVQGLASTAARNTGYAKALFEAANRAGIYINILSLFAVGGVLVQKKIVQPTVLVSFIGYCFSLNFATQGLLFSFGDLKSAGASWDKVRKFVKESVPSSAETITTKTHSNSMHSSQGHVDTNGKEADGSAGSQPMDIQLKDVSFSYKNRPEVVVLHNVNLSIPRGKVTALVGPSGAGKSTIAALLNRFYEPTSGSMIINGVSIENIVRDEYLRDVSVVRQSPSLFTDTVANNIGTCTTVPMFALSHVKRLVRTVFREGSKCCQSFCGIRANTCA